MVEHYLLIIEDEIAIREMLSLTLLKAGFAVEEAASVSQARSIIARHPPSLILLDLMLPDMSGIDFARYLKRQPQTQQIPIIMLTAKSGELDKIRGLEVGADDYVTKPFSPRELVARIKAVLRRTTLPIENSCLTVKELHLDLTEHRLKIGEQEVPIGPTEFRLLHFLMQHHERVYSRTQILDQVWGNDVYIEERTVDVHIRRLRKLLAPFGYDYLIQTVRGVGYRFSTRE
ncbi:MAG: phosphate regulon transcriptional regulatory protein PhoB [Beggiatoa sp. IS2]|nr:MAG: phosphate regulon transcriptional regulatory protein PhoB [Beggiatoa sp. IS2]